jgi:outer membrane immunogenic protein
MKRFMFACVSLLTLAALLGTGQAADLPRRYDPVPPRAPVYYAPGYNWSGFYVGINGGGGWGSSNWNTTNSFDVSGGMAGGTAGFNWQAGSLVFGVEGDADWSNIKGNTVIGCPVGCRTDNSWLATVRGRVGYAFDRFMPYVTGGVAFGDVRARTPAFVGASQTETGWAVGGGVEFAIFMNWTAKAEYLYVDLGKFDCGLSCGVVVPNNVSFRSSTARAGLNYRF